MLRNPLVPLVALAGVAASSGCFGSSDPSTDRSATLLLEPEILGLEGRYALGSEATVRLVGEDPIRIESSDEDIVRIARNVDGEVTLSFAGEGTASLVAMNERGVADYEIEVAPHAAFVVLLTEYTAVPLAPLSGQVILDGLQYVLVLYLDSDGRQLYGSGLSEVTLSPALGLSRESPDSVDLYGLDTDRSAVHTVTVRVGTEEQQHEFETVRRDELVGIEVLRTEEAELTPGTWTQIDVVGLTDEGRHVSSVHPRFDTKDRAYGGYIAYQFDPDTNAEVLEINALDERILLRFRGVPSERTAIGFKF